jgi:hypothetical protein
VAKLLALQLGTAVWVLKKTKRATQTKEWLHTLSKRGHFIQCTLFLIEPEDGEAV